MAVTSQTPRNVSTAAPGATVFPYDFKIVSQSDLLVQVNGVTKVADVDFTVTGVATDAGGDITFLVPMVGGEKVLLRRNMPYQRLTDYQHLGDLRSPTLNNDQDAPVLMLQQVQDALLRSVRLSINTSSTATPVLPDPVPDRAIVVTSDGLGFTYGELIDPQFRNDLVSADPGKGSALISFIQQGITLAGGVSPARLGFFSEVGAGANVHRFRDRVFIGDGANHTGRQTAPYGGSWLTERGASYFEKNAQFVTLSSEGRIAILGGSHTPVGAAGVVNMAIGAVSVNEGVSSTGRAFYAEAMHKGGAIATVGIEIQGGNYTATSYNASAYGVEGGYIGAQFAVEGGLAYTVGDAGTLQTNPTQPGTVAVDVSGGSAGHTWQKWKVGLIFRNGALYRDIDGLTGNATAISMAQGHTLEWRASAAVLGARIRSDVTAVASQDVGILFKNDAVHVVGTGEVPLAIFTRDAAGSGGVNYADLKNGRTGIAPIYRAAGSDTNIGLEFRSKGSGVIRFTGESGASESLRVQFNNTYVNFLNATGGIAGAGPTVAAAGADTNIDLLLAAKGTGNIRFGTFTVNADAPVTGYITIKDSGGTLRKLAVIA